MGVTDMQSSWWSGAVAIAAATLVGLGGCSRDPFGFVPVQGRVVYSDGSPIPGDQVVVRFVPVERAKAGKDVAPAATGEVDPKDGSFAGLTSHTYLDGAVRGRHKVTVIAFKLSRDGAMEPSQAVPERYQNAATTPLEWEVGKQSGPAVFKIEKGR